MRLNTSLLPGWWLACSVSRVVGAPTKRDAPSRNRCPEHYDWLGRACWYLPHLRQPTGKYYEICWRNNPFAMPFSEPRPLTWGSAYHRGLTILDSIDPMLLDDDVGMNPARIPRYPGEQFHTSLWCPRDHVCVQLTDRPDRDAHIACRPRPFMDPTPRLDFFIPELHDGETTWLQATLPGIRGRFHIVDDTDLPYEAWGSSPDSSPDVYKPGRTRVIDLHFAMEERMAISEATVYSTDVKVRIIEP